jgi:hypothetical protein
VLAFVSLYISRTLVFFLFLHVSNTISYVNSRIWSLVKKKEKD